MQSSSLCLALTLSVVLFCAIATALPSCPSLVAQQMLSACKNAVLSALTKLNTLK
ncbi:hypothetical protein AWB67_02271 [Caballeronia terrestris]|uniref:Uncharacterized protein n=1 Tax=Caballeronia terrestris TaxID=1226301 RepID=A0A158I184_9BURK|nr:hypothetical protein AWB67_02271 [Caballeronia terrestris]